MAGPPRDFLSDLFQTLADRSRKLLRRGQSGSAGATLEELADALLSTRGEASGVSLAGTLVELWPGVGTEGRRNWFLHLARNLGPDVATLNYAVQSWQADPSPAHASLLHKAAEPRRQELFRRINLAPGGTATLVAMREALLAEVKGHPELAAVDADFEYLFNSWFNRGFLVLKLIDWSSSADVLEKIIRYEAVHEIRGWDDLKGRLKPIDRRCFAFFHPQMPNEPLVFVEVALTRGIPGQIAPLIAHDRQPIVAAELDTAVFYSITNTQTGLRGISFGNFLIKQVVEELLRELPQLTCFVTLSPVPGFAAWLAAEQEAPSGRRMDPNLTELLRQDNWRAGDEARNAAKPLLEHAAASYLVEAKAANGKPADPVARFHLNNGAVLERINFEADLSPKGLRQSHGVMVNYRYHLVDIERNHEVYANASQVMMSPEVLKMLGKGDPSMLARVWPSSLPKERTRK